LRRVLVVVFFFFFFFFFCTRPARDDLVLRAMAVLVSRRDPRTEFVYASTPHSTFRIF